MSKKLNKKGVTLIELIVVMVIIAIGAVLMVPNIGRWLPNYRLRSATRDIASILRTAQMKAVSNNTVYQVTFTAGTGDSGNYVLQRNSGGLVPDGPTQTLPTGIQLGGITFPGSIAQFNPNSTASSGSVTLSRPGGVDPRTIAVSAATGRVRIN
jgi:prepilin-type N-terminal cleavage/methylation domain-containing protein